jgi:hypothetical protein
MNENADVDINTWFIGLAKDWRMICGYLNEKSRSARHYMCG